MIDSLSVLEREREREREYKQRYFNSDTWSQAVYKQSQGHGKQVKCSQGVWHVQHGIKFKQHQVELNATFLVVQEIDSF